jgi:flagellin-like protein
MRIVRKKGLSEIIGYVLLIVIAISLSLLVYAWMKGLLWKKTKACPDEVSLMIADYSCDFAGKNVTIVFRNNGLFDVDGFIARISNEEGRLPVKLLKEGIPLNGSNLGEFSFDKKLSPGAEFTNTFFYSEYGKILEIEIVPFKYLEEEGEVLVCDKSTVKQRLQGCDE